MTIEILRSVERLLGVIIAGLCIYLGFRLFLALPKKSDNTGRLVLPGGLNVYLSRIGPGAFFALFGCALVVMSFKQAITVQRTSSTDVGTRREIVSTTSSTASLTSPISPRRSSPSESPIPAAR